ncbi:MAG: sugar isomerase [Leifsonia sp.]
MATHPDSVDANASPTSHMASELVSQPDTWQRAVDLAGARTALPLPGQKVAIIGCGTSWFMAQSYASLRETAGQGVTDAFAASEMPAGRDYDAIIALTRSGTTTEVLELLRANAGRIRSIGIVGDTASPLVDLVDDLVPLPFADEKSVVQTRFATTALAFLRASLGEDLSRAIADARTAIDSELDAELVGAEQYSFLGSGWTVGLAHEAALKMREASQSWTESYPAMEYRHGPIAIAAPDRVTWMFGAAPAGLANDVAATGARFESSAIDPLADLVRAQRVALARAIAAGLNPDEPRSLTRSVVLDV